MSDENRKLGIIGLICLFFGGCGGCSGHKVFTTELTLEMRQRLEDNEKYTQESVKLERDHRLAEIKRVRDRMELPVRDLMEDFDKKRVKQEAEFSEERKRLEARERELDSRLKTLQADQEYLKKAQEGLKKDQDDLRMAKETFGPKKEELIRLESEIAIAKKAMDLFLYRKEIPYLYSKTQSVQERVRIAQEEKLLSQQLLKLMEEHQKK
jgi:phosphatidate phosphatase PAH1